MRGVPALVAWRRRWSREQFYLLMALLLLLFADGVVVVVFGVPPDYCSSILEQEHSNTQHVHCALQVVEAGFKNVGCLGFKEN